MTDTNAMREKIAQISDADLKNVVTEILSHRGQNPYRTFRGGELLWETWLPAVRAALAYMPLALLATDRAAGVGELRGALIDMGRTRRRHMLLDSHRIGLGERHGLAVAE